MSKKYKILLTIIVILLVICLGLVALKVFVYDKTQNKKPTVYNSVVDKMDKYGYTLGEHDTKLFKDIFYELKDNLESEELDYEKYAEQLSELFVIDLFTISNKINKYDVGGLDYLYESDKEMFKNKVMDTLYEHVEDNSYGTRKQELPTVSGIKVGSIKNVEYKINDEKKEAYEVSLNIEYEKDLGYDKKCSVIVVKDDDIMYIVKYATIK